MRPNAGGRAVQLVHQEGLRLVGELIDPRLQDAAHGLRRRAQRKSRPAPAPWPTWARSSAPRPVPASWLRTSANAKPFDSKAPELHILQGSLGLLFDLVRRDLRSARANITHRFTLKPAEGKLRANPRHPHRIISMVHHANLYVQCAYNIILTTHQTTRNFNVYYIIIFYTIQSLFKQLYVQYMYMCIASELSGQPGSVPPSQCLPPQPPRRPWVRGARGRRSRSRRPRRPTRSLRPHSPSCHKRVSSPETSETDETSPGVPRNQQPRGV